MTFIPGNPIPFDEPNEWTESKMPCRWCKGRVRYRTHSSSDGAFDDDELNCLDCGKTWWVEGPDS